MKQNTNSLLPMESIQSKIFVIRGKKVLIDRHLAELFGTQTRILNQSVKRNSDRFPSEFMFVLSEEETKMLVSQSVIPSLQVLGGSLPKVFTEHGVVMLACVLNTPIAVRASIQIVKTFNQLREMVSTNEELRKKVEELEKKYDTRLNKVDGRVQTILEAFEELKRLLNPPPDKKRKIGFITHD